MPICTGTNFCPSTDPLLLKLRYGGVEVVVDGGHEVVVPVAVNLVDLKGCCRARCRLCRGIRKRKPVTTAGAEVADRTTIAVPGGTSFAQGRELPMCAVGLSAGLVQGVGSFAVRGGSGVSAVVHVSFAHLNFSLEKYRLTLPSAMTE